MMEEQSLTREILEQLSEPFPEEAIEWKPQAFYPKDNPTRALAVPYITSRHVMDRLDEVVGPANWAYEPMGLTRGIVGRLTIFGITKGDIGYVEGDDDAAIKGSSSDGLKRAGVLFGIGRYLYDTDPQWVGWDDKQRQFTERPQLKAKEQKHESKTKDAVLEKVKKMGGVPKQVPQPQQKRGVPPPVPAEQAPPDGRQPTIRELITIEANAQLVAMGYPAHYRAWVHTYNALKLSRPQMPTTEKYLQENFADLVGDLVERGKAEQPEDPLIRVALEMGGEKPDPSWCPKHRVAMKQRFSKDKKSSWYSHKIGDKWCNGLPGQPEGYLSEEEEHGDEEIPFR